MDDNSNLANPSSIDSQTTYDDIFSVPDEHLSTWLNEHENAQRVLTDTDDSDEFYGDDDYLEQEEEEHTQAPEEEPAPGLVSSDFDPFNEEEVEGLSSPKEPIEEEDFADSLSGLSVSYGDKKITLENKEEAIKLMEMGLRYAKESRDLAQNNKLLATLKEHKLTDLDTLNYAIDLINKNPEAIAKLVAESGVDVYEIDTENSTSYKPNNYEVSDSKIKLDEVIASIVHTPSYQRTMDVVGKVWDQQSRDALIAKPELLGWLNTHIGTGIFDRIDQEIDRRRILGQLDTSLSTLDQYWHVGQQLHEAGKLVPKTLPQRAPEVRQAPEREVRGHKKSASAPRPTSRATAPRNEDVFAMSDEEFLRKYGS